MINGLPIGVVRGSLRAMSTIADVDKFLDFLVEVSLSKRQVEMGGLIGIRVREIILMSPRHVYTITVKLFSRNPCIHFWLWHNVTRVV